MRTKVESKISSDVIPLFHSFLFSHTVRTKWLLSVSAPTHSFFKTNGELIQILRTPRHSRSAARSSTEKTDREATRERAAKSAPIRKQFLFSGEIWTEIYRRPPSPSNGSHNGDTLDPSERLLPPLLSNYPLLIGRLHCHSVVDLDLIGSFRKHWVAKGRS